MGRGVRQTVWLFLLGLTLASPRVSAGDIHNILVVYPYGRLLPGNVDADRGLREVFAARPDLRASISVEYLDNLRFTGESYDQTFLAYLRDKYALHPPDVMLVGADEGLEFVMRHRSELFPQVPIVYMAVQAEYLTSRPPLPANVIGTPLQYDVKDTLAQALRFSPEARRLVVVTGTSSWDREWEARVKRFAADLPPGISVEYLAGLPTAELTRRLRLLPPDSIVFTPGYHRDGDGQEFAPREAVQLIVAASPAPVYGTFSPFMGTGIVGGRMQNFEAVGRVGAQTAIKLLDGGDPATVNRPAIMPTQLELDWRQLQRWGFSDRSVPADAIVRFREPSLWEAHRTMVIVAVAVMLIQTALIAALLLERRRRRRTVAELARSEELIRLAAQAAHLSTWVLDERSVQPAGVVPRPESVDSARGLLDDFGRTLARISPQDRPAVDAAVRAALDQTGELDIEYRVQNSAGEWNWQSARGRAVQAEVPRLLGVAIDITQRKRAETQAEQDRAALYHMTRVSILGQLSASIAHQLNQPLASILGNAEAAQKMLEREPVDLEELRAICADIVAEDQRAAQVIRRLGVLFRRGESEFELLDVNELIRDTMEFTRGVRTTRQITLSVQLAPTLPQVAGDRVQLQQLLLNLMVNAADAMADLPESQRQLTISTALQDGHVKICVMDRGPGVAAADVQKVFEPFWSTRPGGMGMGLAVCRSIVEAHHGRLTVTRHPEGGAVFCTLLPAGASA